MKKVVPLLLIILIVTPQLCLGFFRLRQYKARYEKSIVTAVREALQRNYAENRYVNPRLQGSSSNLRRVQRPPKKLWIMCFSVLCMATETNILPQSFYSELDNQRNIFRL